MILKNVRIECEDGSIHIHQNVTTLNTFTGHFVERVELRIHGMHLARRPVVYYDPVRVTVGRPLDG